MRKLKKVVVALLALSMCIPLAACGERKKVAETPTLIWYVPGDKQADMPAVLEKANEILVSEIGAKIDIQFIDSSAFDEKMKMIMASNNSDYDLCFTGYVNSYISAANKGGLLELDSYLEKYPELKAAVPEYLWKSAQVNGKIYAVPNQQISAYAGGLYVQKALADEYGLDISTIKCLEDIEPFLKWVKENHSEVYPFRTSGAFGSKETFYKESFTTGVHDYVDENGSVVLEADCDATDFDLYARLYRDWFTKGYIRSDNALITNDTQEFNAGKYAVWLGQWKPGAEAENAAKGLNVYSAMITEPQMFMGAGTSTMIGINPVTRYPEKSIEFIQEINTNKELYNLIAFGIEGKHYNLKDGKVSVIANSGYTPGSTWRFGNQFNALILEGQDENVWEETKAFNDSAKESPLLGMYFDTTPVRTEIAQIATVKSKYSEFLKGTKDVDEYVEKYKEELKTAGIYKVLEEAKKQAKEWAGDKVEVK